MGAKRRGPDKQTDNDKKTILLITSQKHTTQRSNNVRFPFHSIPTRYMLCNGHGQRQGQRGTIPSSVQFAATTNRGRAHNESMYVCMYVCTYVRMQGLRMDFGRAEWTGFCIHPADQTPEPGIRWFMICLGHVVRYWAVESQSCKKRHIGQP